MSNCIHVNTESASAIRGASVWCDDCKKWVLLESQEVSEKSWLKVAHDWCSDLEAELKERNDEK